MKNLLLIVFALAAFTTPNAKAQDNERFARVVLFIPAESEPPENYQARLGSLAKRTESFLAEWMEHWERPIERKQIFARNEDGEIEVILVDGKVLNLNGKAALPEIRKQAIEGTSSQLNLSTNDGTIWWIFYAYPGVKGFQGGANRSGGIAINAYPKGNELIDPKLDLAEGSMVDMMVKGTIHEFGHALGLPHIGPRPGLDLGNSLMGPINNAYWRKANTKDTRVHLNEASAAALWKHPVFKTASTPNPTMPEKVEITDLTVEETDEGNGITVRGKIDASAKAHSIIIVDSERDDFGDYWARSYSSKIEEKTGTFETTVSEPFEKGTLFLCICFDNGSNTANGKTTFQRGSTITIQYETKNGSRKFEK